MNVSVCFNTETFDQAGFTVVNSDCSTVASEVEQGLEICMLVGVFLCI